MTGSPSARPAAHLLAGNVGLNLITQAVLLGVYVLATPTVVHGLGAEAYGILAMLLVMLGYFGFLDFGVSQATVKLVSMHIAKDEAHEIRRVVGTSLIANVSLGVLGGILIAGLGPRLLGPVFHLQGPGRAQVGPLLVLFGAALPFVLVQGTLQGVMGSYQRFLEINLLSGAAAALQPITALILVRLGYGLQAVALGYVVLRALSAIAFVIALPRIVPGVSLRPAFDRGAFARLMRFGGWVLVSYVVGPLMVNADRLLVGWLLSAAWVTYYSVPNDVAGRLLIVSGSLSSVLFPAFSRQSGGEAPGAASLGLLVRSAKMLLLVLAPPVVLLAAFARDVFRVWMGPVFAARSAPVLELLAVAMLVNSLAVVPYTALWGRGRPDLTAKFHIAELPLYLGACYLLIPRVGIMGAAIAWCLRVVVDLVLLLIASRSVMGLSMSDLLERGLVRALLLGAALAAATGAIAFSGAALALRLGVAVILCAAYAVLAWRVAFDAVDRDTLARAAARPAPGSAS